MTTYDPSNDRDPASWAVTEGMDVLSSDSEKIGEVANATGTYVRVRHGFIIKHDYYIPASAIANVGIDAVYLNTTKQMAEELGWDSPPADDNSAATGPRVVEADPAEVAAESTEPLIGTFDAPRRMSGETDVDAAAETFADLRSGTQSVDPDDVAIAVRDRELSDVAEEAVTTNEGVSVARKNEVIDPRLEPDDVRKSTTPDAGPKDAGGRAGEDPTQHADEG